MGYFSNGTEGAEYETKYCGRCVHGQDENAGCPIMGLHLAWNYDQVPPRIPTPEQCAASDLKRRVLDTFIPRTVDDLGNRQCTMFLTVHVPRPRRTREVHPTLFQPEPAAE